MAEALHPRYLLPTDVGGKQGPEPVSPEAHRLVADVDTAFEQQILDIPEQKREPHILHHHQADHLRRRIETPERV